MGSAGLLFLVLAAATSVSLWLAASARKEAAKANAVVGLLADMLKSASPHHLKGADYTFRQLLDDFEATLGDQLAGQPEVEGAMRNILGLVYAALASEKAKTQYDRAHELFRRELGEDHPNTLGVQANLASWHRKQGNLWEAESEIALGRCSTTRPQQCSSNLSGPVLQRESRDAPQVPKIATEQG